LHHVQHNNVVEALAAIKSSVIYMFGTIILYGMFIPNTWQRALRIVIPMAIQVPVVMALLRLGPSDPDDLLSQIASFDHISDDLLILALGVVASTYGTHTINELRRQAFKARQLGQYRLKDLLGAGGMGEVYLAEHQLLKRPCAIKLIRPSHANDPLALARFEREVRLTSQLTHSNTITIFDYGRTPSDTFYYVMEFLHGMSLFEMVRRFGPLPPARAVHFLRQACGSLHEAHAAGLIHRDIKPANLFAAELGGRYDVLKVLDFGLVRAVGKLGAAASSLDDGISGSPLYMSPEEVSPTAIRTSDHRGDIYSLGATAYFLLTGQPPFSGENSIAVMTAHQIEEPQPLHRLREDVPADIERIVLRCLAKNPADRFADVESLDQSLAACACAGQWTTVDAAAWWQKAMLNPS
ncbi:MAG: serine/threonine protein kinase, partial [Planctomycetales bacterium]|nr:serine/threonine protein kinase [Planctomycetales bacterium]